MRSACGLVVDVSACPLSMQLAVLANMLLPFRSSTHTDDWLLKMLPADAEPADASGTAFLSWDWPLDRTEAEWSQCSTSRTATHLRGMKKGEKTDVSSASVFVCPTLMWTWREIWNELGEAWEDGCTTALKDFVYETKIKMKCRPTFCWPAKVTLEKYLDKKL